MQSRILALLAVIAALLAVWFLFRGSDAEPESAVPTAAQPETSSAVRLSPSGGPPLPGAVGKQLLHDPHADAAAAAPATDQ